MVVLVDELVDSGMEVLVDVEATVVVVEVVGGITGGTTVDGAVVLGATGTVDVVGITDVTVGAAVVVVVVVSTTVEVVVEVVDVVVEVVGGSVRP